MESKLFSALAEKQKPYEGKASFIKILAIPVDTDEGVLKFAIELASMFKSLGIDRLRRVDVRGSHIENVAKNVYAAQNLCHNRTVVGHHFTIAFSIASTIFANKFPDADYSLIPDYVDGKVSFEGVVGMKKLVGTFSEKYSIIGHTGAKYEGESGDLLGYKAPEIEDMVLGIIENHEPSEEFIKVSEWLNANEDIVKARYNNNLRTARMGLIKFYVAPEAKNSLVALYEENVKEKDPETPNVPDTADKPETEPKVGETEEAA